MPDQFKEMMQLMTYQLVILLSALLTVSSNVVPKLSGRINVGRGLIQGDYFPALILLTTSIAQNLLGAHGFYHGILLDESISIIICLDLSNIDEDMILNYDIDISNGIPPLLSERFLLSCLLFRKRTLRHRSTAHLFHNKLAISS